ncbi:MAG: phosphoribosylformylglycinamidine synthase subunit PurQ, partial [Acidobacteriota bacterium]
MKVKFGVVVFPGSNCDHDTLHVLQDIMGQQAVYLWHRQAGLQGVDAVILPGGFSFGDYLRCGAIAKFSPILEGIRDFAAQGGTVLGICNGFQILQEAGLLPGVMRPNRGLKFVCEQVYLRCERSGTVFS